MKLFLKKKEKQVYMATYEKKCDCCGRKFKATYPASNYYSRQEAVDVVNSHYNAHKLFCNADSARLSGIA